jgi:hypothetical protein
LDAKFATYRINGILQLINELDTPNNGISIGNNGIEQGRKDADERGHSRIYHLPVTMAGVSAAIADASAETA